MAEQSASEEETGGRPERLHVASATGVDLALRIAGLGGRSYAFVIDWHIRVAAAIAWLGIGSLLLFGDLLPRAGGGAALYGVLLPALAIYALYHPVLEVAMGGQTPGKRLAGLRIVTLDGRVPTTGALVVRNLLRLVDSLPALYAVGLTSAPSGTDRRPRGRHPLGLRRCPETPGRCGAECRWRTGTAGGRVAAPLAALDVRGPARARAAAAGAGWRGRAGCGRRGTQGASRGGMRHRRSTAALAHE